MKWIWAFGTIIFIMGTNVDASTFRVITSTGDDSNNCLSATPCVSSSKAVTGLTAGSTVYVITSSFGEYTASTNPYACIDTSNWPALASRTSDYLYIIGQSTNTIVSGCSQFLTVDQESWIHVQSMTYLNGTGGHSVYVTDSSSISLVDIYIKDGVSLSGAFNDVVVFESLDGLTGVDDSVWRRGLIAGRGKYMFRIGGTAGYSERNLIDGVTTRWDGIISGNPSGDISLYGVTGSIEGARNNIVRNIITLDTNDNTFHSGENHHIWYHPHGATKNRWISNIMVQCSTCAGGSESWLGGEENSANNELWNSVMWGVKKNPIFTNGAGASSVTARNVTIYAKAGAVDFHTADTNYENIHRWYSNNPGYATKSGVVSLSSGANAGDSNGATFDAFSQSSNTLIITSPTVPGLIGTGIGGADRGAKITSLAGDGTGTYASTYSIKIHGNVPRFPIANDWAIKSVLCSSRTATPGQPDATGNLRGVCSSTNSISWYILTQLQASCPDGLCPENQAAGGGGGDPEIVPGIVPTRFGVGGTMTLQGVTIR